MAVILSDATDGWSWLILAAVGGMTLYSGVLLAFNVDGAWDRFVSWRRDATRRKLLFSNLTRDTTFESPWVSGGLSILIGVALLVVGIAGVLNGGLK